MSKTLILYQSHLLSLKLSRSKLSQARGKRLAGFPIVVFSAFLTACSAQVDSVNTPSNSGNEIPVPAPEPTCTAGVPFKIKFLDGATAAANALSQFNVQDQLSKTVHSAVFDNCENFLKLTETATFSISNETHGFVTQQSSSEFRFNALRGATPSDARPSLTVNSESFSASIPIDISWTISSTPNLLRWYRADSTFDHANDASIGTNGISPLLDLSNLGANSFNSIVTAAGREPKLRKTQFAHPTLEFCGSTAGCAGVTLNSHLRISSNFNLTADKDLTLFLVIARANNNANFLIANQSNGNNTGLFLGFTSGTNLRLGTAGPGGANQINATIAAYSGAPQLEIITARIDTQAGSPTYGMALLQNGQVIAQSMTPQQQAPATTIPFIGTQRNENNNSRFYFAELVLFERALTENELCSIHSFLNEKYSLGLTFTCP